MDATAWPRHACAFALVVLSLGSASCTPPPPAAAPPAPVKPAAASEAKASEPVRAPRKDPPKDSVAVTAASEPPAPHGPGWVCSCEGPCVTTREHFSTRRRELEEACDRRVIGVVAPPGQPIPRAPDPRTLSLEDLVTTCGPRGEVRSRVCPADRPSELSGAFAALLATAARCAEDSDAVGLVRFRGVVKEGHVDDVATSPALGPTALACVRARLVGQSLRGAPPGSTTVERALVIDRP